MAIPILILAAGASRRMGGQDKLLKNIGRRSLLRHVVRRAVATHHPVLVALPAEDIARRATLSGLNIQIAEVRNANQGIAASLRAGLQAAPTDAAGILVALADMPEITTDDYLSIINSFISDSEMNIHRASTADGTMGNPVLLPRWAVNDPSVFRGDTGARYFLCQHSDKVRAVSLPDGHAITDLDTPKDWNAWHNGNSD